MTRVLHLGDPLRNLELKARDRDPTRSLGVCECLGAEDKGTLVQRDTYFKVHRGRLKLREEPGVEAHLIAYERPDLPDQKESHYRIVPTRNPDELRAALSVALGIWIVVSKARRLFILDGIRIHLDHVDQLGDFIEFEGVIANEGDRGRYDGRWSGLRTAFGIRDDDLLRRSYSDLLNDARGKEGRSRGRCALRDGTGGTY